MDVQLVPIYVGDAGYLPAAAGTALLGDDVDAHKEFAVVARSCPTTSSGARQDNLARLGIIALFDHRFSTLTGEGPAQCDEFRRHGAQFWRQSKSIRVRPEPVNDWGAQAL